MATFWNFTCNIWQQHLQQIAMKYTKNFIELVTPTSKLNGSNIYRKVRNILGLDVTLKRIVVATIKTNICNITNYLLQQIIYLLQQLASLLKNKLQIFFVYTATSLSEFTDLAGTKSAHTTAFVGDHAVGPLRRGRRQERRLQQRRVVGQRGYAQRWWSSTRGGGHDTRWTSTNCGKEIVDGRSAQHIYSASQTQPPTLSGIDGGVAEQSSLEPSTCTAVYGQWMCG